MSYPRIAYKNLWRDGTIIAASSENPQYPAEETQEDSPQSKWRSVGAETAGEYVDCDFGAVAEYNLIGILGHNFTAGATIQVRGADDDAFTSNVVTDTLTYNGNNIWAVLGTARTKRYCSILVIDTGNPSGYVSIGTVVIAKAHALNRDYAPGSAKGYVNPTEVEAVPSGVEYITRRRDSRSEYAYSFQKLNATSAGIVHAAVSACGSHLAVAFCLNPSSPNGNTLWVKLASQDLLESEVSGWWEWSVSLREVI